MSHELQYDYGTRTTALTNSWGTASDGTPWVLASGSVTGINTTTSQLQINANNIFLTIGIADLHDVVLQVRTVINNASDAPTLLLRYTDNNNYIKADISAGTLRIRKDVAGTFTTIASTSFSPVVGVLYWWKFQVQGTTYSVKVWPDGTVEPASFLMSGSATDPVLANGKWGLSATATSGLAIQYDRFTVEGLAYQDNPYGVTVFNSSASSAPLVSQLITDTQTLNLDWLRFQVPWSSIESPQGTYTWTALDAAVSAANTANINITFPLQSPPSWGLDSNGLPLASAMATFATQVATRYNGKNGHGHLDSIEIGNEEFDTTSFTNTTYPGVVNAVRPAIKSAGFVGKIGCAAMLGIQTTIHITNWLNVLYTNGITGLFDYLNLHYYNGANDPSVTGTYLSIDVVLATIKQALIANNDTSRQLWVTEFGYATSTNGGHPPSAVISTSLQNQYYSYILNTTRISGVVQKIFFYSMDLPTSNTDGSSITQGTGGSETYLPAFATTQHFIGNYPFWTGWTGLFPAAKRRTGFFPTTARRTAEFPITKRRGS